MKILLQIILCVFSASIVMGQEASSLYGLSVPLSDSGRSVSLVSCQGKKVLVAVCDARNPDTPLLAQLDELQKKYQDRLRVIVIPVNDVSSAAKSVDANRWRGMPGEFRIAEVSAGKKSSGNAQHPLLRWVTDLSGNGHFNHDITEGGYLFVISETGRLFAVLKRSGSIEQNILQRIIDSKVVDH
ncbi:MAG: hypothetical protein H3C48_17115 [Chitinophagaceae bacterium]|nr:hypothetical protein [Chitinophagaceae bacterium]